ncbi:MAG: biotin transporter BioY [Clostridiales bacterium]|nr:biotin transporter BioY [Clostridiales bacterium]
MHSVSDEKKDQTKVKSLVLIALMSAVICVLGPLSIPIGPVPISLTNLAIYFIVYILGWKKGTVSYLIYLMIGMIGLPVFSSFSGGLGKLVGPTGGYLIGFIFVALISGLFVESFPEQRILHFVGMVLGTVVVYTLGTAWLAYQAKMTFGAALAVGVTPFIVGDVIKMILAVVFGPNIRRTLQKANLI